MNTIERRVATARRKYAIMKNMVTIAKEMRAQGKSNLEIAHRLGVSESAARLIGRDS